VTTVSVRCLKCGGSIFVKPLAGTICRRCAPGTVEQVLPGWCPSCAERDNICSVCGDELKRVKSTTSDGK